jgi:hypothetical protein
MRGNNPGSSSRLEPRSVGVSLSGANLPVAASTYGETFVIIDASSSERRALLLAPTSVGVGTWRKFAGWGKGAGMTSMHGRACMRTNHGSLRSQDPCVVSNRPEDIWSSLELTSSE